MDRPVRLASLTLATLLVAGCNNTPTIVDSGSQDLVAGSQDLVAGSQDLVAATTNDLTMPVTSAPDLAGLPDLATSSDLTFVPSSHTVMVGMGGLSFVPSSLTINVGETVHWVWAANAHTVTSGDPTTCTIDNTFCSPNNMNCSTALTSNTGATYDRVFATPGTFNYFCRPHCGAGMTGSITVLLGP